MVFAFVFFELERLVIDTNDVSFPVSPEAGR